MEWVPLSLLGINEELLERKKIVAPVYKTEINGPDGSAALNTRHPLTTKVGTTSPAAAVAQSV
jgi:hypothetical protein